MPPANSSAISYRTETLQHFKSHIFTVHTEVRGKCKIEAVSSMVPTQLLDT